jgi:hypothetical protein
VTKPNFISVLVMVFLSLTNPQGNSATFEGALAHRDLRWIAPQVNPCSLHLSPKFSPLLSY